MRVLIQSTLINETRRPSWHVDFVRVAYYVDGSSLLGTSMMHLLLSTVLRRYMYWWPDYLRH